MTYNCQCLAHGQPNTRKRHLNEFTTNLGELIHLFLHGVLGHTCACMLVDVLL